MKAEILGALLHLTIVVNNRNPPLGYKRGQAVGPDDFASRRTVLHWLVEKYPNSLLHRLLKNINPIATCRIFNQLLDGRSTYSEALEECCQLARDSGHDVTDVECITTSILIDEAFRVLDSPFMVDQTSI
jgi:hypothetical protein